MEICAGLPKIAGNFKWFISGDREILLKFLTNISIYIIRDNHVLRVKICDLSAESLSSIAYFSVVFANYSHNFRSQLVKDV